MDFRLLIFSLFFLVSCLPEAQVGNSNISNSQDTSGTTTGGVTPPGPNRPVLWNYLGQDTTTISLSGQNLQTSYIGGTQVETFLSIQSNAGTSDYCTIVRYNVGGNKIELRTKTLPFQYMDFSLQRFVKIFRVDFNDVASSVETCGAGKIARVQSPTTLNYILDNSAAPFVNSPSDVLQGYSGVVQSTSVGVYKKNGSYLDKVPDTQLMTQSLILQIDPNGNPGGDAGTCSNSSCQAINLDCCLDNQCVKNGAPRPGMIGSSLYNTAEAQRATNPLIYLLYPQVYYVCGTSNPGSNPGSTTGGSTGGVTTPPAMTQAQKDYYCIENIKGQSTSVPYHFDILNPGFTAAENCLTGGAAEQENPNHYYNSFKRLYQQCGCASTTLPEMINNCPNYEYKVKTWESIGGVQRATSFECTVLPTAGPPANERTIQVNSKSAPHRYFTNSLPAVESPTPIAVQEGPGFSYDDADDFMTPIQAPLSMNAILGQMSLGLSEAHPAKSVEVELDRVYFLTTNSGTYSPCPTCAKDSWINSFSAFPKTFYGTGLQSVGFTTKRDDIGSNVTLGNYEDTIFGRACWVPPTMLPYSQTSSTSRLDRLQTQSALFANGYQRDWFGFNKGSLIGSFDGVTWFAIGQGRIVRSTSTKLFLAINAPFADLANPTIHEVFVQNFNGITQATTVDYDPQFHQDHSLQNAAGTCQKHHMCETDKDCITGLGWEYACADVRDLKTYIPKFDSNAKEFLDPLSTPQTLDQILQQKQLPSGDAKRCVYRGAGSICATSNIANLNKKKLLTCAPNFFCAGFNTSYHNNKISRYAGDLSDTPIYYSSTFGKSAKVLGRPLNYIGKEALFSSGVGSIISSNIQAIEPSVGTATGLCQPGKALPNSPTSIYLNPFEQHKSADSFNGSRRADSINQIGSCNASFLNSNRHISCPVLNDTGNYAMFDAPTLPINFAKMATAQNSCGLESLDISGTNPFASIEALTGSTTSIVTSSLVQNACLRRAGSVCHTDLDCSPNILHSDATDNSYPSFFGNQAELDYYKEYLVCGQKDPEPSIYDALGVKNYKIAKNVCCREVGQTITTYTANVPKKINVLSSGDYYPATAGLKMSLVPGVTPQDTKRYSRLAIATSTVPLTAAQDRNPGIPSNLLGASTVNTPDQWTTLAEVNSKTCCGGGWVRKFSDGSNDWSNRNRVYLDVTNFRCINSRTPLLTNPKDLASSYNNSPYLVESLVANDHEEYCKSAQGVGAGCAYFTILNDLKDIFPKSPAPYGHNLPVDPTKPPGTIEVRTIKGDFTLENSDFYFTPLSADGIPSVFADFTAGEEVKRKNIAIRIPSYISKVDFDSKIPGSMTINAIDSAGVFLDLCYYNPALSLSDFTKLNTGAVNNCEYSFDINSRVLKVGFKNATIYDAKKVGISFRVAVAPFGIPSLANKRTIPGSSVYYLKRLGRLELSGIPQITFEALYCNDNSDRILPGIFQPNLKVRSDFENSSTSFRRDYPDQGTPINTAPKYSANMHTLENPPVFSAHEFKCCSPLGLKVGDGGVCCSGFAKDITGSTQKMCALPSGTNLMVYFNKFVSNEGRSLEVGDGKLQDTDFEAQTGEIKIESAIIAKVRSLGTTHCEKGKVRVGGAFGEFDATPGVVGNKLYNIVDSPFDKGTISNAGSTVATGYQAFHDGFKWNHHLYCDD